MVDDLPQFLRARQGQSPKSFHEKRHFRNRRRFPKRQLFIPSDKLSYTGLTGNPTGREHRFSGPGTDAFPTASERNIELLDQFEIRLSFGENQGRRGSMRIKKIEHVQLAMPPGKESEARNFYEGVLGIPEVPKPANLAKRGGCWFVQDGLKLHLGVENEFRPARKAHPALLVEDLPALKTRIEAAGCNFKTDEPLEGYDRIYVDDPFGNRIELMEPLSN